MLAPNRLRAPLGALGLGLVVAAFAAWSARHLGVFEWSIDEGMYLMRARMLRAGYPLYDAIWFNHPPLLVELVRLAFDRFGESVAAARGIAIGFAAVGLIGVGLAARELEGWPAGILAALLLATAPLYAGLGRAVMSTLPALACATLALALALRYGRTGLRRWLVLSGAAFGVGLAVKYIGLPLLPAIALAAWPGARTGRHRAADGLLWSALAGGVLAAVLLPHGPAVVWGQTVGSVLGARDAYPLDVVDNLRDAAEWLNEGHLGIALLGAFGLGLGLARDRRWRVVALWLGAAGAAVLVQAPLWSHHLVLPLLPLAVAGGAGAVALPRLARSRSPEDAGWRAFGATAAVVIALVLPVALRRVHESTEPADGEWAAAVEALAAAAQPGGVVITDSPMHAFRAGLHVPPNLCDPGAKRFDAGDLTLADVAGEVLEHFPAPVLTWNGRFASEGHDPLLRWLRAIGYRPQAVFDAERQRALYAPPMALATPPRDATMIGARWAGEQIVLEALEAPARAEAGTTLPITLHWRAAGPLPRPLTLSLRLVNGDGQVVAQEDQPPAAGVRPTDAWRPGERIPDAYALGAPDEAGPLTLVARWYASEGGDVVPPTQPGAARMVEAGTALALAEIEVVSASADGY